MTVLNDAAASIPRFNFGKNWSQFLVALDDERIEKAEASLKHLLGVDSLQGRRFLDVGSGSGLSSLVARRSGAEVFSFDLDSQCIACTRQLKDRFFPGDMAWKIERGSVLDKKYLNSLGQFDVVYSWGVLHHTGALWEALANVDSLVVPGGTLSIAIYNDQGRVSDVWRIIKRFYNWLPEGLTFTLTVPALILLWGPQTVRDLLRGKPFSTWRGYAERRGMSAWHDLVDWVGGYPFEVARPETIVGFYEDRRYRIQKLKTCGRGLGCNEFVFTKL